MRLLVVGYGNELRGDDGAGPGVARVVAGWLKPGVVALALHQLVPELADRLAEAEEVIFVDASVAVNEVTWEEVVPGGSASGHTIDPGGLLAVTQLVYGRSPTAWLLLIPATTFDHGEQISPDTKSAMEEALARINQR